MQQESARKILAASFTTPDGGSRAAGALGGSMRDKIGNTAVLFVRPDGKAKFIESKDWGARARRATRRCDRDHRRGGRDPGRRVGRRPPLQTARPRPPETPAPTARRDA